MRPVFDSQGTSTAPAAEGYRAAVSALESSRDRLAAFAGWRSDLQSELARLPATLRQLREGVADFQVVARRLAASTEGIERVGELYGAGLAETTRRLEEASSTLRRQLGDLPAGDGAAKVIEGAAEDFNRTLTALAELNPLWPKRRPKGP